MKTIINVCGLQRSGTTMLSLMLAHGASAVPCGELAGWYRVARYRAGARLPEFWQFLAGVDERECYKAIFDHTGVDFVIDSSKSIDWIIDVTKYGIRDGYKVVNLLIFKNPVDQAFSAWKRNESVYISLLRYFYYHARMLFWSGLDFWTVNYDRLIDNPSAYLKSICDCLNIPYFRGKEEFWKGDYPPLFGSNENVKRQLSKRKSSIMKNRSYPDEFIKLLDNILGIKYLWNIHNKLSVKDIVNYCENNQCFWNENIIIKTEILLRKKFYIPLYRSYLQWRFAK